MEHTALEGINNLANLLRVMGTPTRVQIIYVRAHERVASILTLKEHFNTIGPFVLYQNLTYLQKHGIIKKRRKGREIFYSLIDFGIKEGLDLLSSSKSVAPTRQSN